MNLDFIKNTFKKLPRSQLLGKNKLENFKVFCLLVYLFGIYVIPYSVKIGPLNTRTLIGIFSIPYFVYFLFFKWKSIRLNSRLLALLCFFLWALIGNILNISGLIPVDFNFPSISKAFVGTFINTVGTYLLIRYAFNIPTRKLLIFLFSITSLLSLILIVERYYFFNIYDIFLTNILNYQPQGVEKRYIGTMIALPRPSGPFTSPILTGFFLLLPSTLVIPYLFDSKIKPTIIKIIQFILITVGLLIPFSYTSIISYVSLVGFVLIYFYFFKIKNLYLKVAVPIAAIASFAYIVTQTYLGFGIRSAINFIFTGQGLQIGNFPERYQKITSVFQIWLAREDLMKVFGSGLGLIFYQEDSFFQIVPFKDFGLYMLLLIEVGVVGLILFTTYMALELIDSFKTFKRSGEMYFLFIGLYYFVCLVSFWGTYKYIVFISFAIAAAIKDKLKQERLISSP